MNRPFNVPIALPRGPEHYWSVAKKFGAKGFTLGELAGCTNGVAYSTVKNWLYDMLKVGAIKTIGARKGPVGGAVQNLYAVALKAMKAPVQRRSDYQGVRGKTQQQVWTAMRTLGTFSLVELTAAASTPEHPVKPRTAEEYVRRLTNAGVLAVVEPYAKGKPGATGARAGTWRLVKRADTGPLAPKVFNASIVFDANTQKIVGESEVAHG